MLLHRALDILDRNVRTRQYMEAAISAVQQRAQLAFPVFIHVPEGDVGSGSSWDEVRSQTTRLCDCGARRLLMPTSIRPGFIAGADGPAMVGVDKPLYLCPWAGDWASAYVKLSITYSGLEASYLPCAPRSHNFSSMPSVETSRRSLAGLRTRLLDYGPFQFKAPIADQHQYLGAITAVDPSQGTVTILPDVGVTIRDYGKPKKHAC